MKKLIFLMIFAALLSTPSPALASEMPEEPAHDGYLIRLREDVAVLFSALPEGVEAVVPEVGLYLAEALEDAAYFPPESLEYVEPNYIAELFSEEEADAMPWNLEMMGADVAQAAGLDGSGVRVGVVDSGLYAEHNALTGARILRGHNYMNGSSNTSDTFGHGTFVTGIITAATSGAEIVPLKCFDGKTGDLANIAAAIYGGVDDYGCDILNLSFGTATDSQTLRGAVDHAAAVGVMMMAAAGNDGTETLNYPAAYDAVIGVGMVDQNKSVAAKSQRNNSVFITAPGSGVTGLGITSPNAYRTSGGTSFACPHVTAAAALMKQALPELTAEKFMDALREGAEDLGEAGYDTDYGHGLISMTAMLAALPLEPVPTAAGLEFHVVLDGWGSSAQIWTAGYSAKGRMLEVCLLETVVVKGNLAVSGVMPAQSGMELVRVFFLEDGSSAPLEEAQAYRLEAVGQ